MKESDNEMRLRRKQWLTVALAAIFIAGLVAPKAHSAEPADMRRQLKQGREERKRRHQHLQELVKQWIGLRKQWSERIASLDKAEPVVKVRAALETKAVLALRKLHYNSPQKRDAAVPLQQAISQARAEVRKVKDEVVANDEQINSLRQQMDELAKKIEAFNRPRDHISQAVVQKADEKNQSQVTFDLRWKNSWRTKWTEPADKNVTGKDLVLENWNAAWVFVKFKNPDAQGFSHATLSPTKDDHVMPAGATCSVGLSDDRKRGMGVFAYRAAPGTGANDWKQVRLRWLSGADGVADPAKVEVKVYALEMVYVPEGAFALGSGGNEIGRFYKADAPAKPYIVTSEAEITTASKGAGNLWGAGGVVGDRKGWAPYGTKGFYMNSAPHNHYDHTPLSRMAPSDGSVIPAAFPKGYGAFYCLKDELMRPDYTDFLNALPPHRADRFYIKALGSGSGHFPVLRTAGGYVSNPEVRTCKWMSWWDGAAYAAWAGLRPMTELEFEKACRGPHTPEPNEYAWGKGTPDGHTASSPLPSSFRPRGVFAQPGMEGFKQYARASYWGILLLSGGNYERAVTIGNKEGRAFQGTHGAGMASLPRDWPGANIEYVSRGLKVPEAVGVASRGGDDTHQHFCTRVSTRHYAASARGRGGHGCSSFRGVRTAP